MMQIGKCDAWVPADAALPPLDYAVEVRGDHTGNEGPFPIAWRAACRSGREWEWLSLQWRGMVGVRAWRYPDVR
jgi:hypothetical protein